MNKTSTLVSFIFYMQTASKNILQIVWDNLDSIPPSSLVVYWLFIVVKCNLLIYFTWFSARFSMLSSNYRIFVASHLIRSTFPSVSKRCCWLRSLAISRHAFEFRQGFDHVIRKLSAIKHAACQQPQETVYTFVKLVFQFWYFTSIQVRFASLCSIWFNFQVCSSNNSGLHSPFISFNFCYSSFLYIISVQIWSFLARFSRKSRIIHHLY